ncbi:MAG: hypothetical protein WAM95_00895, partial [Bacillus sp. (in: firmicutes)]
MTLWNAIYAILAIKVRFSRKNAFFLCFNIANCSFIYSSQKKPVGENWDKIKECIMKIEDKEQMQRNIQGKYRKIIKHKGK